MHPNINAQAHSVNSYDQKNHSIKVSSHSVLAEWPTFYISLAAVYLDCLV